MITTLELTVTTKKTALFHVAYPICNLLNQIGLLSLNSCAKILTKLIKIEVK